MKTVQVHVRFEGVIDVHIPDRVSDDDISFLAQQKAIAYALATCKNDDPAWEYALTEYVRECSVPRHGVMDWEKTILSEPIGNWEAITTVYNQLKQGAPDDS